MSSQNASSPTRWWLLIAIWLVMFLIALSLDRPVAVWVHQTGMDTAVRGRWFAEAVKIPGTFGFAAAVAIVGLLARQLRLGGSLLIVLASVVSGSNGLVKWIVGRTRPFRLTGEGQPLPFKLQPFWHGVYGLFHQKDLCFPSGHACTSFALAVAVAMAAPRWWWVFGLLAAMVCTERVLENAHYLSDVIGALGLGAGGTLLVSWALNRWLFESAEITRSEQSPVQS